MNISPEEAAQATLSCQGFRCGTCDRPFRQFQGMCLPVEVVVAQMQAVRCPFCGGRKILMGEGRSLSEDRGLRMALTGSPELRAGLWLEGGEVGMSSKAIALFMLGQADSNAHLPAPRDLDDVRRCLLLLDRVPEWLGRMPEMAPLQGWTALATNWDALSAQYLAECPNLSGAAPRTGALLARLLQPEQN